MNAKSAFDLGKFQQLTKAAEKAETDAARLQGRYDAAMAELQRRGYKTIKAAQAAVDKARAAADAADQAYAELKESFEEEWGGKLDSV